MGPPLRPNRRCGVVMGLVLNIVAFANVFVSGVLTTTVVLDVILNDVSKRTYVNSGWVLLNLGLAIWCLCAA